MCLVFLSTLTLFILIGIFRPLTFKWSSIYLHSYLPCFYLFFICFIFFFCFFPPPSCTFWFSNHTSFINYFRGCPGFITFILKWSQFTFKCTAVLPVQRRQVIKAPSVPPSGPVCCDSFHLAVCCNHPTRCHYHCFKQSYLLGQLRIRKIKAFLSPSHIPSSQRPVSDLCHFLSAQRTSQNISCRMVGWQRLSGFFSPRKSLWIIHFFPASSFSFFFFYFYFLEEF